MSDAFNITFFNETQTENDNLQSTEHNTENTETADFYFNFENFLNILLTILEEKNKGTQKHIEEVFELAKRILIEFAKEKENEHSGESSSEADFVPFDKYDLLKIKYTLILYEIVGINIPDKLFSKKQKLYPDELKLIRQKISAYRNYTKASFMQDNVDFMLENPAEYFKNFIKYNRYQMELKLKEIDEIEEFILKINEGEILSEDDLKRLEFISNIEYINTDDEKIKLIDETEKRSLSLLIGCYTDDEKKIIEENVKKIIKMVYNFKFPKETESIPLILKYLYYSKKTKDEINKKDKIIADILSVSNHILSELYKITDKKDKKANLHKFARLKNISADLIRILWDRILN